MLIGMMLKKRIRWLLRNQSHLIPPKNLNFTRSKSQDLRPIDLGIRQRTKEFKSTWITISTHFLTKREGHLCFQRAHTCTTLVISLIYPKNYNKIKTTSLNTMTLMILAAMTCKVIFMPGNKPYLKLMKTMKSIM